ncbi:MAG: cell wall hydrolase [Oscillospiraceae bacterium]
MKRLLTALLACALLTGLPLLRPQAASRTVSAEVNGRALTGSAYLTNGTTYVPIRSLLGALGQWEVHWESGTRSAVASGYGHYITAVTGSQALYIDGVAYRSPGGMFVMGGATYVPMRMVAEALGLSVRWDSSRQCAVAEGSLSGARSRSGDDYYWLSRIISAESRGEAIRGQVAVGNVVLNRVQSAEFAGDIKSVVFERSYGYIQFEPVSNGTIYDAPTAQSCLAAKMALAGYNTAGKSLYFYAPALSSGSWIRANRTYYTTIGCHRFYL